MANFASEWIKNSRIPFGAYSFPYYAGQSEQTPFSYFRKYGHYQRVISYLQRTRCFIKLGPTCILVPAFLAVIRFYIAVFARRFALRRCDSHLHIL